MNERNYEAEYEEQKSLQSTNPAEYHEYPEDVADGSIPRPGEEEPTDVVFLFEQDEDTVFAFFPCEHYNHDLSLRTCYAHVGQHSACAIDYANGKRIAKEEDYKALKNELEGIGYKLNVLNYRHATHYRF